MERTKGRGERAFRSWHHFVSKIGGKPIFPPVLDTKWCQLRKARSCRPFVRSMQIARLKCSHRRAKSIYDSFVTFPGHSWPIFFSPPQQHRNGTSGCGEKIYAKKVPEMCRKCSKSIQLVEANNLGVWFARNGWKVEENDASEVHIILVENMCAVSKPCGKSENVYPYRPISVNVYPYRPISVNEYPY